MSLDVTLRDPTATYNTEELYWANVTHNLTEMADEAGIYEALWHPHRLKNGFDASWNYDQQWEFENNNPTIAKEIIPVIEKGLSDMKARPDHYEQFNPINGWGSYDRFVPWIERYLEALKEYPEAIVEACG